MESSELKHKTFHSVIWAVIRVGTSNVLGFILFLVLARVLSPRDFGVFALATLVVDIARVISTAGLSDAITRDKAADEVLADTAFWASLVLGCAVGAAAFRFGREFVLLRFPGAPVLVSLPPVRRLMVSADRRSYPMEW